MLVDAPLIAPFFDAFHVQISDCSRTSDTLGCFPAVFPFFHLRALEDGEDALDLRES